MLLPTIAESLHRSVTGDAFHGPSLRDLLADITMEEAQARPIPGAHSILEIVLHVGAWIEETGCRLKGFPPALPAAGDWPPPVPWPEAQRRLFEAYRVLRDCLECRDEALLGQMVGDTREAPLGTGVTFAVMLVGLAEHNAYHGGQIALLIRAVRGRPGLP